MSFKWSKAYLQICRNIRVDMRVTLSVSYGTVHIDAVIVDQESQVAHAFVPMPGPCKDRTPGSDA